MIDTIIVWLGYFCLISLLVLLLVFLQTQIYWYLQKSQYFWLVTFLWIKTKLYYKEPKKIELKGPDGKYYKIIEVKDDKQN